VYDQWHVARHDRQRFGYVMKMHFSQMFLKRQQYISNRMPVTEAAEMRDLGKTGAPRFPWNKGRQGHSGMQG
jgi:hypothetical protein